MFRGFVTGTDVCDSCGDTHPAGIAHQCHDQDELKFRGEISEKLKIFKKVTSWRAGRSKGALVSFSRAHGVSVVGKTIDELRYYLENPKSIDGALECGHAAIPCVVHNMDKGLYYVCAYTLPGRVYAANER